MKAEVEEWLPYFENRNIPIEEKEALIRTIMQAMKYGVDEAWERHPVQQSGGYLPLDNLQIPENSLDSNDNTISMNFDHAANDNEYEEGRSLNDSIKKQG